MNFYLLDMVGSGADFASLAVVGFIILILAWALLEGTVISLFRIARFFRSVFHALIVNLASFIAGFLLLFRDNSGLQYWIFAYLATVVIEGLLLKAFNTSAAWQKIFMASIIMNLVTYIPMYLIFAEK